jgi:hypothetical protein
MNGCKENRRGAVAVELAVLLPVLLVLVFGTIEIGRGLEAAHLMTNAAREGARFAAMDREGMLGQNQTTNDKIESDVRNFLTASGLNGGMATIDIVSVPGSTGGTASDFDIEDPDNDLELFRINVLLPYSAVSYLPPYFLENKNITASVVFRNKRSALVN